MRLALLASLTALAPLAFADVLITSPAAGGTASATTPITVQWKESGSGPAITTFTAWQALLVGGGQDDDTQVRRGNRDNALVKVDSYV